MENQQVFLDIWSLQKNLKTMEEALEEWNNKLILETYKPIYEKMKKEVGDALTNLKTIEEEREKVLKYYLVLNDALESTEGKKAEVDKENLDQKLRIQFLEKQVSQLQKEVSQLKKEVKALIEKTVSLSEENKELSQKLKEQNKELNIMKLEANELEKDQDMIILGDFAYQFQNLLAKIFGKTYGITILQVQEMIEQNYFPQGIKVLERVGATDKKVLKNLDKALRDIKDSRNLLGHKAIKTKMDTTLEEIEEIAQRCFLTSRVAPIIKVWRALMPGGKIFDASTWKLNA